MEHTDVCFAPVLTMSEAAEHPHNIARSTIVEVDGIKQPAPAPRFSRTTVELSRPPAHAGQHTVRCSRTGVCRRIASTISSSAAPSPEDDAGVRGPAAGAGRYPGAPWIPSAA